MEITPFGSDPLRGWLKQNKSPRVPLAFIFIGLNALEQARLVRPIKTKPDASHRAFVLFAVRGGFEPPEQFPVRQFSKLVV